MITSFIHLIFITKVKKYIIKIFKEKNNHLLLKYKINLMEKVVATIEARMTSSRLPGKVLLRAGGISMLEHLVRRLQSVESIDEIVLATINDADIPLINLAKSLNILYFRGS